MCQARYLLQLVCYPVGEASVGRRDEESPEESASRVVEVTVVCVFEVKVRGVYGLLCRI